MDGNYPTIPVGLAPLTPTREVRSNTVSWKRAGKLVLSLGLLAWLVAFAEIPEIGRVLGRTEPQWLAAAFGLYLIGQTGSAWKWRMLAAAVGFHRPVTRMCAYYFVGMFFNAFGFGTVGGDVIRAVYLAEGKRRGVAMNTVIADRVSGVLVLLALALAALLAFRTYDLPAALYWTIVVTGGTILVGWRLAPRIAPLILPSHNAIRRLVEIELAPYWNDFGLLFRVSLLSLVFHLSQVGVLWLLAQALRLDVPGTYFFIFGPLVNVFSALPISWNGLGIRESGYVFFLGHIGFAREVGVAFGFLWLAIVLLASGVGGIVYVGLGERRAKPAAHEESR